jgi:hypothetical protein
LFGVLEKKTGSYLQPGVPKTKRKRKLFHMEHIQEVILEEVR